MYYLLIINCYSKIYEEIIYNLCELTTNSTKSRLCLESGALYTQRLIPFDNPPLAQICCSPKTMMDTQSFSCLSITTLWVGGRLDRLQFSKHFLACWGL